MTNSPSVLLKVRSKVFSKFHPASLTKWNFISIYTPREAIHCKTMGRKFFVGGNWKMNGNKSEIDKIVAFLKTGPLDPNVGTFLLCIIF